MIKTLIVSGGNVEDNILTNFKNEFNYVIASDRGLEELDKYNIVPNYIIGDFDSIDKEILNKYIKNKDIKIMELNPEKDYTDTHMALKLAIELKSTSIIIIGAIGTRLDHTIANIHILKEALDENIECRIIDSRNEIQLINKKTILDSNNNYKYINSNNNSIVRVNHKYITMKQIVIYRGMRGMRASGGDAGRFLERKLRKELPGIFGRSSSGAGFFAPAELKKSLTILSP